MYEPYNFTYIDQNVCLVLNSTNSDGEGGSGGAWLKKKKEQKIQTFTEKMSKSTQIKKWIKELDFIFIF